MRRYVVFAVVFALLFCSAYAEKSNSLSLEGTWTYTFSGDNKSCTIRGDKIVNRSDSSNFFKVAFLLLEEQCTGFPALAYSVGEQSYSILQPNYQYENTSFTLTGFKSIQPKTGTYYPVIALLAYKNGEYGVTDYLIFSQPLYFKNSIDSEVSELIRDLERAEEQEQYWQRQMFNSYDGGAAARQLASQYTAEKNSIRSKLGTLNYNSYTKTIRYASLSFYTSYSLISDRPTTTASSPTYVPDYSNSYSSPPSSSSSSSELQKIREVCRFCNGTGRDSAKTATANYAGASYKPYCDFCREYTYPHHHKTCIICQGRGYTERYSY